MPKTNDTMRSPPSSSSLPTGIVTFLFSDIEGSTQRWEQHGDAMKHVVERHDALVRAAIKNNAGHVFKTIGDAFCAAFCAAPDAIAAALDMQRCLAKEDFSTVGGLGVRIGLHIGSADEREGDYFGPTVNRTARLMSIGHGGQVLASNATRNAVQANLPVGVSFVDLGSRRLKDLTLPEHVWQLCAADLPRAFPPLNSLDARQNNLPYQSTSFLGRERDLEEVKVLLDRTRLLTLVGAGGIGKTRLSLQAGADSLDRYADGVWFVELARVTDPALVAEATAAAVGANTRGDRPAIDSLADHLRRKKLLLILDNCEHVIEAAAQCAAVLLQRCPEVRIIATSRQALRVGGETVHRLPSLDLPEPSRTLRAFEAERCGAVALFVDRAHSVNTKFVLGDDNAATVVEICRRLDGIPLAIELAAARVNVLSIAHLAQRLDEKLSLLTSGDRTVPPRQKTLRATIDWSHELLSTSERVLFRRVAVFVGGFSLDAATAVCAGADVNTGAILDLLASLIDKSLVVADTGGSDERFRLLESTREYALEKLAASGEALSRAHAEYFLGIASSPEGTYATALVAARIATLEPELGNFRAALSWTLGSGNDAVLGGMLVAALNTLWVDGGLSVEGRRWATAALTALGDDVDDRVVARLCLVLAYLSDGKRKYAAAERGVALFERLGDRRHAANALIHLGRASYQLDRLEESEAAFRRALAYSREAGNDRAAAHSLSGLASALDLRGDIEGARRCFSQALAAYAGFGDDMGRGTALGNLAELEFAHGNVDEAERYGSEALAIFQQSRDTANQATYFSNLAAYRIAVGRLDEARSDAREAIRLATEAQAAMLIAAAVQHLALIGAQRGDGPRAAKLLGYVDRWYRDGGNRREPTESWGYKRLRANLCGQLTETELTSLLAEGAGLTEDRLVAEAMLI